jgi:prepilin-type N-terminal cleavage/methylation domain-containing protein
MVCRPRGATLIELLVVLALLGIVGAAISRVATGQQRSYRVLAASTVALGQAREGSEVLASELAGIAPGGGDLYDGEMRDASIGFRSATGTWLLCGPPGSGANTIDAVRIASAMTSHGQPTADGDAGLPGDGAIATSPDPPSVGDSLWIRDAGTDIDRADDQWRAHSITAVEPVRRPCPPAADTGETIAHRMTIAPAPSSSLAVHAPVRLFRRARYALYQSGDGGWYLGFSDCRPLVRSPACAPMQPVSGPYLPAATGASARSGLTFAYLDRTGAPTTDAEAVAAIELVLRASAGDARARDTIVVRRIVAFRNAGR